MEERIYKRQVTKESTAKRITEEAQIQRHFLSNDLDELYKFEPDIYVETESQAPRLAPPKDRLLGDIISKFEYAISSYHPHDCLFDEVEDEKLTDKEREEAWEEYKRERTGKPQTHLFENEILSLKMLIDQDPFYVSCLSVVGMTTVLANLIVFVQRCLDYLHPHIPTSICDMKDFSSYFQQLLQHAIANNQNSTEFYGNVKMAFRTIVGMAESMPECKIRIHFMKRYIPTDLFCDVGEVKNSGQVLREGNEMNLG